MCMQLRCCGCGGGYGCGRWLRGDYVDGDACNGSCGGCSSGYDDVFRMCRRLQANGFSRVICCDSIGPIGDGSARSKGQVCDDSFAKGQSYDVVALMNVIDRCHDPSQVRYSTDCVWWWWWWL